MEISISFAPLPLPNINKKVGREKREEKLKCFLFFHFHFVAVLKYELLLSEVFQMFPIYSIDKSKKCEVLRNDSCMYLRDFVTTLISACNFFEKHIL